jgi:hypothetical protein
MTPPGPRTRLTARTTNHTDLISRFQRHTEGVVNDAGTLAAVVLPAQAHRLTAIHTARCGAKPKRRPAVTIG